MVIAGLTPREAVRAVEARLSAAGCPDADYDARELFRVAAGRDARLSDRVLTTEEAEKLEAFCTRREQREPLQYLCGIWSFLDFDLAVGPGVLCPRADTEVVAEAAANTLTGIAAPRVLDLCAAPGGKSTELGAKLQGKGLLFSNDISNSRAKALLKNLEMAGISNFCVSSETPEKLSGLLLEFFDKILVDAPCSGEGMFRRDPDMIKSYEKQGPSDYVPIQRSIVSEAVNMLKPGGLLLYSTCTFDEEENEGTIRYLLERFPDMKLLELPQGEGFSRGIGLPQCVRLFPHRIQGEGHFIALLQKDPKAAAEAPKEDAGSRSDDSAGKAGKIPSSLEQLAGSEAAAFLSAVSREFPLSQLFEKNGSLYLLPEAVAELGERQRKSIRFLRTGLLLGEIKKGRFEPSQALAMALKKEEYPAVIDFQPEDERAVRYLKGETIAVSSEEEASLDSRFSWILVCTGGFPLGWAKRLKGSLKNKYYPGWRWQ